MAKALGTTPEEEHRAGLSNLATVRRPPSTFFPFRQVILAYSIIYSKSKAKSVFSSPTPSHKKC